MRKRETWGSKLGFILAAAGSAVGLANIWRFPYIVGAGGGGAFLIVYLICLLLIGFPVFIAEALIGRSTYLSPADAFEKLGKKKYWGWLGTLVILTGFMVSAFYSAVAAWIVGYLYEAAAGNLIQFDNPSDSRIYYSSLIANPWWTVGFHLIFIGLCTSILIFGVRGGIEKGNKIFMPLLYIVLFLLVGKSLSMPGSWEGVRYLFIPDWSKLNHTLFLTALGQAFFTLSLGQGTMTTYGSYLKHKENMLTSCMPVAFMDTMVSLFAAVAVFGIVFAVGLEPNAGPGLIFHTLPLVFSKVSGGYLLGVLFFLLVFLAAVTSEISAMEPAVAYLIDHYHWKRKHAVLIVGLGGALLGIPCALSTNVLSGMTLGGATFLEMMDLIATSVLIPLGGLLAIILVGWVWGADKAIAHLKDGAEEFLTKFPLVATYFRICFKYVSPILILFVFLNAIGVFG